jgi:hypothetical protein
MVLFYILSLRDLLNGAECISLIAKSTDPSGRRARSPLISDFQQKRRTQRLEKRLPF